MCPKKMWRSFACSRFSTLVISRNSCAEICHGLLQICRNQNRRQKCVVGFATMSILANGNRSAFSCFCAMTIGVRRRRAVICR